MDEGDIRRHVDELDAAVTKDNAELVLFCEDPEPNTCEFVGNRQGYLRAGIELLRAALVPLGPNDSITWVSLDYLIRNRRSLGITRLTRQEDIEAALPPLKKHTWQNKAAGVGCITVLFFLAICTVIGVGQVLNWVFGK